MKKAILLIITLVAMLILIIIGAMGSLEREVVVAESITNSSFQTPLKITYTNNHFMSLPLPALNSQTCAIIDGQVTEGGYPHYVYLRQEPDSWTMRYKEVAPDESYTVSFVLDGAPLRKEDPFAEPVTARPDAYVIILWEDSSRRSPTCQEYESYEHYTLPVA